MHECIHEEAFTWARQSGICSSRLDSRECRLSALSEPFSTMPLVPMIIDRLLIIVDQPAMVRLRKSPPPESATSRNKSFHVSFWTIRHSQVSPSILVQQYSTPVDVLSSEE
ncbi:hypothetical protein ABKN59_002880 [Abortiporus biennis]